MITLKEAFLSEDRASLLGILTRRLNDAVVDQSEADHYFKQYQVFLALVDDLAGSDLEAEHTSGEVAYRRDPSVDPFFKAYLSRVKHALIHGHLDWDHLPNEKTFAKMVIQALVKNTSPQPTLTQKHPTRMSPEDHAERMHRGDYGKLDQ